MDDVTIIEIIETNEIFNMYVDESEDLVFIEIFDGKDGERGLSAYEVAVENGFPGTETEWLLSLKGDQGNDGLSAYELAAANGFVGTEGEWLLSLQGNDGNNGKSAYELASDNGFVGSETDWLASLVGADGLSAYQLWLNLGNVGSIEDYQLWLKASNTLEDARALDNKINGDIDANSNKIVNAANASDPQDYVTLAQLQAQSDADRSYAEGLTVNQIRLLGDYNLVLLGQYPTTGGSGSGGSIRRNDAWRIPTGGDGTFNGINYNAGDILYAVQAAPGQVDSNWYSIDYNTQQATETVLGTAKIAQSSEVGNENSLNDKDILTPKKAWLSFLPRILALPWTWASKQTFSSAPRLNSVNALQYLKTDANKDVTSVANIPAADVSETTTKRFVTDTQISTWDGKQNALGFTPEDSANKSTSTADTASSTKFPVWSAILAYFDASRIRTILGQASAAASGWLSSTDWNTFNNKQNALGFTAQEDIFYWLRNKGTMHVEHFLGTNDNAGIGTSLGVVVTTSGTGSVGRTTGTFPNRTIQDGVLLLSTGTTSTGNGVFRLGSANTPQYYIGNGAITYEVYINIETLSNSTDRFTSIFGAYTGGNVNSTANGIFFIYDEGGVWAGGVLGASPNWRCVSINTSTRTVTNSGVAISAGGWVKLRMEINSAGTSVGFYINNTLVATHTTNIPSTSTAMHWYNLFNKTAGTTSLNLYADYLAYLKSF